MIILIKLLRILALILLIPGSIPIIIFGLGLFISSAIEDTVEIMA